MIRSRPAFLLSFELMIEYVLTLLLLCFHDPRCPFFTTWTPSSTLWSMMWRPYWSTGGSSEVVRGGVDHPKARVYTLSTSNVLPSSSIGTQQVLFESVHLSPCVNRVSHSQSAWAKVMARLSVAFVRTNHHGMPANVSRVWMFILGECSSMHTQLSTI